MKMRDRNGPLYVILLAMAAVLVYLGRQHAMLVHYNTFLLGLCGLALVLVVVAWTLGGRQDAINLERHGDGDEAG